MTDPRTVFLLLLAVILGAWTAPRAHADPCVLSQVLTLSYTEGGYPPYYIVDGDVHTGITHDILVSALTDMGWSLRTVFHSEPRGLIQLDRNMVDCRGKAKEWIDNPDDYLWTEPFLFPQEVLVSRAEAPVDFEDTLSGKDLVIVGIFGFAYPRLKPCCDGGSTRRIDVASPDHQLFLLKLGRADAAIMDEFTARWLIKTSGQYKVDEFHIPPIDGTRVGYRLMFSKLRDWGPFIHSFDKRIAEMRKRGDIDRILRSYR